MKNYYCLYYLPFLYNHVRSIWNLILWRSGEHSSPRYIFRLVAKEHYSLACLGYSPLTWLTIRVTLLFIYNSVLLICLQVSWTKLSLGEIKQRSFPSSPGVFNKIPINKLDTKPLHFNLKRMLNLFNYIMFN